MNRTLARALYAMVWLPVVVLGLSACGSEKDASSTGLPATPAENLPDPRPTLSPTLIRLQRDYENLSEAHDTMTAIWEALANGETARCGDYPELVTPGSIRADGDAALETLASALRQAAVEMDTSLNLWRTECLKPRANPSPDVIQAGRLATRSAGDSLRAAAPLLSAIQVPAG